MTTLFCNLGRVIIHDHKLKVIGIGGMGGLGDWGIGGMGEWGNGGGAFKMNLHILSLIQSTH